MGGGWSVSFSADNRLLLAGHDDGYVRIWRIADGTLLQEIPSHCDSPSVAFSPNGSLFAFHGGDESDYRQSNVKLWNVSSGEFLRRLGTYHSFIAAWRFSPTGTYIAIAVAKHPVDIGHVNSGGLLRGALAGSDVFCIAFSPDEQIIALSTFDHEIKAFSVLDGSHLWTISDLADDYYEIAFINNSALIIASDNTDTIQIRHLGE